MEETVLESYEFWAGFFMFFCFGFIVSLLEIGRTVLDGFDSKVFYRDLLLVFLLAFIIGMIICGGFAYDAYLGDQSVELRGD
jgi:hypothetical protein